MKFLLTLLLITTCLFSIRTFAGPIDEAYYLQLVYAVDQDLSDPEFPGTTSYSYIGTSYNLKFKLLDGTEGAPELALFMFENHTFEAYYRENIYPPGSMFPNRTPCSHITGTWTVPDTKIVFQSGGADILIGDRANVGNLPGIEVQLLKSLGNAEFIGKPFNMGKTFSNFPKEQYMCF